MADMNVCLRQEPVSPNLTRVLLSPSGSHYSPLPPRLEPRLPRAKRYLNARIWPMSGCIDAVGRNEVCRGLMPRCNAGAGLGTLVKPAANSGLRVKLWPVLIAAKVLGIARLQSLKCLPCFDRVGVAGA
jgi:hypothetical protein